MWRWRERPWSERAEAIGALLLLLGASAGMAAHCAFLRAPIVDDAAISLAYGLSLFHGEGFRLTHASGVVEAFSSPLWTVLLGLSVPLRVDPVRFTALLGIVLGVVTLPVIGLWGPLAEDRLPRLEDAAGPVLCAGCTSWAYWSASGMETGLFALLLAVSGALLLWGLRSDRYVPAGVAFGLACLTRPEASLYVVLAAGAWLVWRARGKVRPGEWRGALAFLAITVGSEVFRLAYFGDLLPNTYYAKHDQDFGILRYLGGFLDAYPVLVAASGLGLLVALAVPGRTRVAGAVALAFTLAGVLFVVRFKGDWMREWRFLAPIVPAATAGLSLGLAGIRSRLAGRMPRWALAAGMLVVSGIAWGAQWPVLEVRAPLLQRGPELPMEQIAGIARALQRHIEWVGMRRPKIAFPDIGGLGLTLPESQIVDTGILADIAMGRHRTNYPAAEDYLLTEGMPAYIDIHGPSGYVEHYHQLLSHYAPVYRSAPRSGLPGFVWILEGLGPRVDPRCPGSRAEVEAFTREQLEERLEALVDEGNPSGALQLWACAFTYQPEERLPPKRWREALADRAQEQALTLSDQRQDLPALRYQSLSAVLDSGSPQRRRLAENLRDRVFPPPPVPPR